MFKKALSLILSLMLIVTSLSVTIISVSAADDETTYVVAGMQDLTGFEWVGDPTVAVDNVMTAKEDGTYEKVFTDVAVANSLQLKVVANPTTGEREWIGDETGNNITFNVTTPCDVTVNFDPATKAITVTGDGVVMVTSLDIENIYAVGNGDGTWLNGAAWEPDCPDNIMTETSENVYQITFNDVEEFDNYEVKFAANGTWADSWGFAVAGVATSGEVVDGVYNGKNINVVVPYTTADVTLTLDLTNFNYATKLGAKIKIDVVNTGDPVETTVEVPTTEEPTEATTEAPTEAPAGLTVTASSNYFPQTVQTYDADTKQITVTYFLQSEKNVLNAQWALTYDNTVLKFNRADNLNAAKNGYNFMPQVGNVGSVYNSDEAEAGTSGNIWGNCSNLSLYDFSARSPFVTVTFEVIGTGNTTVDLDVEVLTVSKIGDDFMTIDEEEVLLVNHHIVNQESTVAVNKESVVYEGPYDATATNPATTTPVETTAAPTTTVAPTTIVEPTEATTVAPTTEAPTEATTVAPTGLTVTATSNYFPQTVQTYDADTKQITVTYFFESEKNVLNAQWGLTYDNTVLKFNRADNLNAAKNGYNFMPQVGNVGSVYNSDLAEDGTNGEIWGNCSNLSLYDFSARAPFVTVTFEVIGTGNTTVDLDVEVLTVSKIGDDFMTVDEEEVLLVNHHIVNQESTVAVNKETVIHEGPYDATATNPATTTPVETTVPATEATTEPATEPTTPVAETVYVVAGSEALCGVNWVGDPALAPDNIMTKDGDVYVLTFADVNPANALQIKVVANPATGDPEWIGDSTGNNITFNVTDVCDVTVTFDPATKEITVTGDAVEMVQELIVNSITAVGNGEDNWLNNESWNQAAAINHMTEITDGVYEITFEDIEAFDNYQVKFAANDAWADSWGGTFVESGVPFEGVYNGDNILIVNPYDMADVTLKLDLTNFNYATKQGAVITVTLEEVVTPTEPETTVPETTVAPETTVPETTVPETTVAPETTVPETTVPETTVPETTVPETTVAPETTVPETTVEDPTVGGMLNVKATSNFFPSANYSVEPLNPATNMFTVTYYFDSAKEVLNSQWTLSYDPTKVELNLSDNMSALGYTFMPQVIDGGMYNVTTSGTLVGNCSSLSLYNFDTARPFVQVTFRALTTGDTTVDLNVDVLTLSEVNPETGLSDESKEEAVVDNGVINPTETSINTSTGIKEGYGVLPTQPITTAPTEPVTTAPTEPVTTAPTEPVTTAPTEPVTTAPTEPVTTVPTEPVTTAPTEPVTTVPTEPVTTAPTEPVTTAPTEPVTTAPTEPVTTAPTEPVTTVPTEPVTTAPTEPETTESTTPETTVAPATDATSATGATISGATSDTPSGGGNGSVQTGNASMAIIILLVLVSATGALFFTRKRIK